MKPNFLRSILYRMCILLQYKQRVQGANTLLKKRNRKKKTS